MNDDFTTTGHEKDCPCVLCEHQRFFNPIKEELKDKRAVIEKIINQHGASCLDNEKEKQALIDDLTINLL